MIRALWAQARITYYGAALRGMRLDHPDWVEVCTELRRAEEDLGGESALGSLALFCAYIFAAGVLGVQLFRDICQG